MKWILVTLLFISCTIRTVAQTAWAGPDTVTCGEKGVMIGSMTPCQGCCYSWSPKDGLSDAKIKNPIAKPRTKTTYTVVVTDENLSWKQTDDVVVDLTFGEMHFVKDHLIQGTEEFVLGRLMNNDDDASTTWSLLGDDLGCILEPNPNDENRVTIYPGDEYGKLIVKVRKDEDAECFFRDTLPVNNGVKDLIVVDPIHPGRRAETGDTLWVVGHNEVQLIAIPNEGGFVSGIPDYKPDAYGTPLPEDGVRIQTVDGLSDVDPGKYADYIAGDSPDYEPRVTVSRVLASTETDNISGQFNAIVNWWENLFNFPFITDGYGPNEPYGSGCPPQMFINPSMSLDVLYKESPVEKFNDRHLGIKEEYVLSLNCAVSGRLYHPYFTRSWIFAGYGVCSQLSIGVTYSQDLNIGVSRDESQENSEWKMDNPQLEVGLTGDITANASLLFGNGYNLEGGAAASTSIKLVLGYNISSKELFAQLKLNPATIKFDVNVVNETNMGETQPLFNLISEEVILFEGGEIAPVVLHTFD